MFSELTAYVDLLFVYGTRSPFRKERDHLICIIFKSCIIGNQPLIDRQNRDSTMYYWRPTANFIVESLFWYLNAISDLQHVLPVRGIDRRFHC